MSDLQKIVFLDIDGPLIPASMFFMNNCASMDRTFSLQSVAMVAHLLKRSGAKLVTNSTHNRIERYQDRLARSGPSVSLREDLVFAGIPTEAFHENWKTEYPWLPRKDAIDRWLKVNGDADWVALDDVQFTDDPRLVLVDCETGLTTAHYNHIAEMWGLPEFIVLM